MILLIDAGNTRIKWGIVHEGQWRAEGLLGHDQLDQLGIIAATQPRITRVLGANVAGAQTADGITKALGDIAPAPQWLQSSAECCGVSNSYDNPAQLGSDRWAALIGAHVLHPGACLVVNAGTATTVDVLDASGTFRGGIILPGEHLMRRSLARDTAQLPFADGHYATAPRNTADAITSGCRNAQAGAVERMYRQIAGEPRSRCLLSGGGADALAELLDVPFTRIDNLVLKGLAVVATGTAAT